MSTDKEQEAEKAKVLKDAKEKEKQKKNEITPDQKPEQKPGNSG